MQYSGGIILVQDVPAVMEYVKMGFKVVNMSEDLGQLPYMVGPVIKATILLPPCDAMAALMDNQYDIFNSLYLNYLSTNEECLAYQDILILSAIKGINIVLYIERDELELGFYDTFAFYMLNYRGIGIGNAMMNIPFSVIARPEFDIYNLIRLYYGEFITAEEFMTYYPLNFINDLDLSLKLYIDMYGVINAQYSNDVLINHINKRLASRVSGEPFKKEGFIVVC